METPESLTLSRTTCSCLAHTICTLWRPGNERTTAANCTMECTDRWGTQARCMTKIIPCFNPCSSRSTEAAPSCQDMDCGSNDHKKMTNGIGSPPRLFLPRGSKGAVFLCADTPATIIPMIDQGLAGYSTGLASWSTLHQPFPFRFNAASLAILK